MDRPFRQPDALGRLLRWIVPQLRPGATLFDVYDGHLVLRATPAVGPPEKESHRLDCGMKGYNRQTTVAAHG